MSSRHAVTSRLVLFPSLHYSPTPILLGAGAGDTTLRLLELEDEIKDLRKKLDDREEELKSRQDEVLCLSASLLEKEQLLFGAGIQVSVALISRPDTTRAFLVFSMRSSLCACENHSSYIIVRANCAR